jgi:predicted CopG family antitoxin
MARKMIEVDADVLIHLNIKKAKMGKKRLSDVIKHFLDNEKMDKEYFSKYG